MNIQNATCDNVPEENRAMINAMFNDACSYADLLGVKDFYWELQETDTGTDEDAYRVGYPVGEIRTARNFVKTTWFQEYNAEHALKPEKNYYGQIKFVIGLRIEDLRKADALLAICFYSYYKHIVGFCDKNWTTRYIDAPKEVK